MNNPITRPFEPVLYGDVSPGNFNYTNRSGEYTVIGNIIVYSFDFTVTNYTTAGASGNMCITVPVPAVGPLKTFPLSTFGGMSVQKSVVAVYSDGRLLVDSISGESKLITNEDITTPTFGFRGGCIIYRII